MVQTELVGVLNFISPKVAANGKIENQLITNYQTNNNLIATSFRIKETKRFRLGRKIDQQNWKL